MTALMTAIAVALFLCIGVLVCNAWVVFSTRRFTYNNANEIPYNDFAVVLGTSPIRADGKPNRYYVRRLRAAKALYDAGKANRIILSGGYKSADYDEAASMRQALMAKGIPASALLTDKGGERTLLSVKNARDKFGVHRVTFISQRFHNERAIFLARQLGLDAIGYNAEEVHGGKAPIVMVREWGSRVRAVIDILLQAH